MIRDIQSLLDIKSYREALAALGAPQCPTCSDTGQIRVSVQQGRFVYVVDRPCPRCADVSCPTCVDKGEVAYDVPIEDARFGRLYPCPKCAKGAALAQAAYDRALRNAALPEEYKTMTFDTWDALPESERTGKYAARIAVALWATSPAHTFTLSAVYAQVGESYNGRDAERNSLLLAGHVGVGKTGLMAAAVNYFAAQHAAALYIRVQDLLTSLKAAMDKAKRDDAGYESPEEILDRVKRAPILILDEFSTNQPTDWRRDQIEELIRFRYGNHLPTGFTTNANKDDIEREWGLRTASAVLGMAHVVRVAGVPLRIHADAVGGW